MKNIFIVSYECDTLKNYFLLCNKDIQSFIKSHDETIKAYCEHNTCNRSLLHEKLSSYNDDYIVSIYAHGNDDTVVDNEQNDLINMVDAKVSYNGAIVYATSCYTANTLGKEMHSYNCKFFFGYTDKSYVVLSEKELFIELDNFALKKIFLTNSIDGKSISDATDNFFWDKVKEVETINPMLAPLIMHNKEAFKIYHNRIEYPN